MKSTIKRCIAAFLSVAMLGTVAGCGNGEKEIKYKDSLKILAIGNSFSVDGMEYLWDICKAGGIENVVLGNLYIGGCTLDTHWKNISGELSEYTYYKNTDGVWMPNKDTSVQTAIKDEQWDIITVQQASGSSGIADTYSHLNEILDFVKSNKPKNDTKIMWHMTWAYQGNSTHGEFPKYDSNQITMYNAIINTVKDNISSNKDFAGIIPSGTAIQNLRSSYVGDTVTRDGYHLSYSYGRYTAALTWFSYVTGASPSDIYWVPSDYVDIAQDFEVIRESVDNAVKTPFEVTTSKYDKEPDEKTDADLLKDMGLDINDYQVLDWKPEVGSHYDSTKGITRFNLDNSEDGTPLFYVSSELLDKDKLPVGSVVIQDYGYQYFADGWKNESYIAETRPSPIYERALEVTKKWWGKDNFKAFSLSYIGCDTFVTEDDIAHLRIYVPKK